MSSQHRLPRVRFVFLTLVGIVLFAPLGLIQPSLRAAPLPGLAIPSTPAGEQLAWALQAGNEGGASLTEAEVAARFTEDYVRALPPSALIADIMTYLVPIAPVGVARFEGGVTETRARALLRGAGGQLWRFVLEVEPSPPHRITTLYFRAVWPVAPPEKAPRSWKALERRLQRLAPEVSFIAAEVSDGECRSFSSVNPDEELAVASSFKLYVLGELARQVEAGEASWDELMPLRAGLKSLPSGELLYYPDGSLLPLRSYAERMISESDNTATDHLIHRLGRRNVEEMMAAMGHAAPERNRPLLLTREWFAIKIRMTPEQVEPYLRADEEGKRRFLRREVDPLADTLWDGEDWIGPYLIDSVEWFASAADLCRAVAMLHDMAGQPGLDPIENALSLEPGIMFDPAVWSYVGYKGGYESGVRSHVWLLQRADGRWFTMAVIANDPKKDINGAELDALMIAAGALLEKRR